MFIAKPFSYFDRNGRCEFPSFERVLSDARSGVVNVLVLDANVCLNISNYVRGKATTEVESMIRQFLLAVEFTKVDVAPFLGCIELASNRRDSTLDLDKLQSFESNIKAALAQSETALAKGALAAPRKIQAGTDDERSIAVYYPMLRSFYGCFLKIYEIRSRGHLKDRAVKNFIEFFDWCENLKCHVGIVSQAAFALFGGAQEAQTLLSIKADETPLQVAWGAAWDVLHCWMVQSWLPLMKIEGFAQWPIFVTDDAAAAYVAGHCSGRAAFLMNGTPVLSTSTISYEFPYYSDKGDRLNELLSKRNMDHFMRMVADVVDSAPFDHTAVEDEIVALENRIAGN